MSTRFAIKKTVVDSPQPIPDENPWLYFDTSLPFRDEGSHLTLTQGAITNTPTTYENRNELDRATHIWIVQAGKNTSPSTHTGGRTCVENTQWRIYGDHTGGDAAALKFFVTLKNHNPLATNYTAEPWTIILNGSTGFEETGAGAVGQFSEWLYVDHSVPGGIMDYTRSFKRDAAPHANGAPWGAFRIQSTGTKSIDYVLSIDGKVARGVDTSPAGADCPAPLIMAAGQWVYWNAVATPDVNGSKLYATNFGSVRTGYTSDGWDLQFAGAPALRVKSVSAPSNYLYTQARETGVGVFIGVEGADTNIDAIWMTKGAGSHQFRTHGFGPVQFLIGATASAVNFPMVRGSATGSPVELSAQGLDADIGVRLLPKGAGTLELPSLVSRNYATDASAAAGGIPVGGLYHNAGAVRVRLT